LRLSSLLEQVPNISYLLTLVGRESGSYYHIPEEKQSTYTSHLETLLPTGCISKNLQRSETSQRVTYKNFQNTNERELHYRDILDPDTKVLAIFRNVKEACWRKNISEKNNISTLLERVRDDFYSTSYVAEVLNRHIRVERKLAILILRFLFWLEETDTGIYKELKLY
jgi:hypothetical protein